MHERTLIHEIWLDPTSDGQFLPGLCQAGPVGDDFRRRLEPEAKFAGTIEGFSHFDVMSKYYKSNGWGEYRTEFKKDYEPFPEEWVRIQQRFLASQTQDVPGE
ncbi:MULTISPECIES: hypothetical protein [unclassified Mesorhizobium]|uniref:hypothetical protein n=1 Tax=unclassified Mesorhizobium TaxID=325217 RepID=UPI0030146FCB